MIHEVVSVAVPMDQIKAHIADPWGWLAPVADRAYAAGEDELRVKVGAGTPRVAKTVSLRIGAVRSLPGDRFLLPLRWQATGPSLLFPIMDANLEVSPRGPELVELGLWGSYDPPLDWIGRQVDRLVLHRVAEASVRSFLDQAAEALVAAHGSGSTAP